MTDSKCCSKAFNWLTLGVESIKPAFVGVDCERAFWTQVSNHFTGADILVCPFHFKQAIQRKMINLCIAVNELKFALQKGVIDLITVIPKQETQSKGHQLCCYHDSQLLCRRAV